MVELMLLLGVPLPRQTPGCIFLTLDHMPRTLPFSYLNRTSENQPGQRLTSQIRKQKDAGAEVLPIKNGLCIIVYAYEVIKVLLG